jgi:hypothetical protein
VIVGGHVGHDNLLIGPVHIHVCTHK